MGREVYSIAAGGRRRGKIVSLCARVSFFSLEERERGRLRCIKEKKIPENVVLVYDRR